MSTMASRLLLALLPLLCAPPAGVRAGEDDADGGHFAVVEARTLAEIRGSSGPRLSYPGARHLADARRLALAGETAGALEHLDSWLDLDYRHSNWWVNHVPIPRAVGEVALLLRDDLGAQREARVTRVLKRAWPPPRGGIGTGANLFYRLDAAVLLALLKRDAELLEDVFDRAAREIRVTKGEGIQEDMSFHQHGPQFYSGSYGLEYVRGAVRLATLGHGTELALSQKRMDLLERFLLGGMQWIVYGPMIDPGAQGRNFSRTSANRGGQAVRALCWQLAALGPPRADELEHFATDLRGNRCFWRSDFMVQRCAGWYASTKMASVRTVGTESGNGEGLQQYHLADGACLVMQRGDEYEGIQPVWNWRRVPGTTCKQGEGPLPRIDWGRGARGTTRFVGGVSDGAHGVACMDFDRGGVRAKKAWFYFDEEVVCLGAGITADGPEPVVTTINQCNASGFVRGEGNAFHHDGVGYVALEGGHRSETALQRGTWRSVNARYEAAPVEKTVFTAWIDHGTAPSDARYAYVVRPVTATPAQARSYADALPVEVLANTPKVQAVAHPALRLTGYVFYQAGALGGVAVDRPCALLVRETGSGSEIHVADPAQANEPIQITLRGAPEPLVARPHDGRTLAVQAAR